MGARFDLAFQDLMGHFRAPSRSLEPEKLVKQYDHGEL